MQPGWFIAYKKLKMRPEKDRLNNGKVSNRNTRIRVMGVGGEFKAIERSFDAYNLLISNSLLG